MSLSTFDGTVGLDAPQSPDPSELSFLFSFRSSFCWNYQVIWSGTLFPGTGLDTAEQCF